MNVAVVAISYTIIGFKDRYMNTKSKSRLKEIVPNKKVSIGVSTTHIDVEEEGGYFSTDNVDEPKEVLVEGDDTVVNSKECGGQ